ncbi:Sec-dependent nitrous-oxide reductase [Sulfurimonas xiamenensis]|jgi:nitrous-oxide reductase|uniref:Sec-dependent nitrous-oxide reductase n=1 Tax=Sulfurimonas xiamenensis TaxID=2590021 RepID=A0AAJ4A412_9BACT|nr:Sec-dependent nitrous-oxide reductase [Sulfurimonas xiamenensis]
MIKKYLHIMCYVTLGFLFVTQTVLAESQFQEIMKKRGLTEEDAIAALKVYNPSGKHDEYYVFVGGGQSGQVLVYGVPSMRPLKYIGVFTPEPWQGYGFDTDSKEVLRQGNVRGREINWGDTHHPALSETDGKYDGEYLFINDKANTRIAVIDLKYFETSQIVVNPIFKSTHGGAFVTPNTEYVLDTCQYAAPLTNDYYPIEAYQDVYRGGVTFWKFDRQKGKIQQKESFSLEFPPYMQDLTDLGKGVSEGWAFTNSINSELYTGGIEKGLPPFEAGCSRNDTDFLHIYNWKKLAQLAKDDKNIKIINGHRVIPIDVAVKNSVLFLVPENKSPHGVDVSPDGRHIIVSGKLDTHASVYDFNKIMKLIQNRDFEGKDSYGIPILDMKKSLYGQVEVGLGHLHNTFGKEDGTIYSSMYVDSQVVKWNYKELKVIDKIGIHYNVGHLEAMEGKSADPQGEYLIAINKLAIDRFLPVGPLHPQNNQLIDIGGKKMKLLLDMPIPLGEPHQGASIRASKIRPEVRFIMGTNSRTGKPHVGKTLAGQEKIERKGNHVSIYATVVRSHINPERVTVNKGDHVTMYITNVERAQDETHGFTIDHYNVHTSLEPGETTQIDFIADIEGVFPYYCTEFCSALHIEMMGYLLVKDPNKNYEWIQKTKMQSLSPEELQMEYKKIRASNKATDEVIQSLFFFLEEKNYTKYTTVKNLVDDAKDQYAKIDLEREKSAKAYQKNDINNAILFENMIWQYMIKTADSAIRAKDLLINNIATPKSESAKKGEIAFREGGCSGCHVIGKISSGPDLIGVLKRHRNAEQWVAEYVKNPQSKFNEPFMKKMIEFFNLKMPNQNMSDEEIKNIVEYFKWIDENADLF